MQKKATVVVAVLFFTFFSLNLQAQVSSRAETDIAPPPKPGISLNFSVGDTTLLSRLIHGDLFQSPFRSFFTHRDSTDDPWMYEDSTDDSLLLDLQVGDLLKHKKHIHSFLITEPPYDREIPHLESMPFMDFNRVNGFYLGIATPGMFDFGPHEEFGVKGGIGYGFEEKKGQSQLAGEYRIPLKANDTSIGAERWQQVPTLALGTEYHNVTTTNDAWRTQRGENSVYAFLVREDFRDYFKIEGWDAYLAFRPSPKTEVRIEYRGDDYFTQPQRVFHGRWGGGKDLPANPAITEGTFSSWVITAERENVHDDHVRARNIFGDTVTFTRLRGRAYLLQAEFGKNKMLDSNYQRYILDIRSFNPVIPGISFDTRLRMESGTNAIPIQMAQYLGGPSSLPALKNKVIPGNRLALLNTELRISLGLLTTFFQDDPEIIILNDFGFCEGIPEDNHLLQGFGDITFAKIVYNVGIGIGHPSGLQLGVSWRTDVKEDARFFFRFQRPF